MGLEERAEVKRRSMVARYALAISKMGYSRDKVRKMVKTYEAGLKRMGRLYLGKEILFEEG